MIDYTTGELDSRVDRYFGDKKDEMLSRRYQVIKYVNRWRREFLGTSSILISKPTEEPIDD